ncbi:MAG: shikimate dehydrogenase [Lachnospiraceae bacterium]|nr:shikimate dehydrogenase [Lachnospiraceae bacterium]
MSMTNEQKGERRITARTGILGLLGHPVGHSLSPCLQNGLAEFMGTDQCYLAYDVEPSDLEKAVEGAHALGMSGLNVTVPHKQAVREFLLKEDEVAARIGAVNTLKRREGGWKGYNTDVSGFLRACDSDGVELKGKKIVLLGAGGAAYAVLYGILSREPKRVLIYNRSVDRAQALQDHMREHFPETDLSVAFNLQELLEKMSRAGDGWVAVQTTSLGMYPETESKAVEDPAFYELLECGVDIVFNPAETAFMKAVRAAGPDKKAYNGLKMLLFQGVRSFEIWNDVSVPDEVALELLGRMRAELDAMN